MSVDRAFRRLHGTFVLAAVVVPTLTVAAQTGRIYTAADYTRATSMLTAATSPLVDHAVRGAQFFGDDRFWYVDTANGDHTLMVGDAAKGTKAAAYDSSRMAAALHAAGLKLSDPKKIVPQNFDLVDGDKTAVITVTGQVFKCALGSYTCTSELKSSTSMTRTGRRNATEAVASPDGKRARVHP